MWSPTYSSDELYHYGILGMHWGVRRYQNPDGTLTAAGRRRLNMGEKKRKKHQGLTDDDKAQIKEGAKSAAKTALKIGATIAISYAGYKVATSPKLRRMAMRGMDRLKGINTKQSIEQLINNSGPQIVKKTKSNSMDSLKFGNEALSSASKLANEAKKVTLGTQYSKNASWQAMHEKIDKSALEGLHQYHPSERASKVKTVAEAAQKQHAYLNELERNATRYGAQVKSGAKVANTTAARATDLEKLLANNRRMQMMANESYKTATKSTESFDYAKELLKKNKGRLSNMTMKDLYDLDLY